MRRSRSSAVVAPFLCWLHLSKDEPRVPVFSNDDAFKELLPSTRSSSSKTLPPTSSSSSSSSSTGAVNGKEKTSKRTKEDKGTAKTASSSDTTVSPRSKTKKRTRVAAAATATTSHREMATEHATKHRASWMLPGERLLRVDCDVRRVTPVAGGGKRNELGDGQDIHGGQLFVRGYLVLTTFQLIFVEAVAPFHISCAVPLGTIVSVNKTGGARRHRQLYGLEIVCKDFRKLLFRYDASRGADGGKPLSEQQHRTENHNDDLADDDDIGHSRRVMATLLTQHAFPNTSTSLFAFSFMQGIAASNLMTDGSATRSQTNEGKKGDKGSKDKRSRSSSSISSSSGNSSSGSSSGGDSSHDESDSDKDVTVRPQRRGHWIDAQAAYLRGGWGLFNPQVEFERFRVRLEDNHHWRVSTLNEDFEFAPTYPPLLCVPARLSDEALRLAGAFRSKQRLPVCVWRHPRCGATLTRCSQPLVGLRKKRSVHDEYLLRLIREANPTDSSVLHIVDCRPKVNAQANLLKGGGYEIVVPRVGSGSSLSHTRSKNSSSSARLASSTRATASPTTAGVANGVNAQTAGGAGSVEVPEGLSDVPKYGDGYNKCELEFADIGNIHVMRQSLEKLAAGMMYAQSQAVFDRAVRHTSGGADSSGGDKGAQQTNGHHHLHQVGNEFGIGMGFHANTSAEQQMDLHQKAVQGWLDHVKKVLSCTARVTQYIQRDRQSVLIHCSDGWDRTAQVSSLAQIVLDPYMRTLKGFCALVTKEWCWYGHKLAQRHGHQEGTMAKDGDTQRSPIFLQFLDCCWQLLQQHPTAFEFNESLLLFLSDHVYSCLFGTFLFDNDRERRDVMFQGRVGDGDDEDLIQHDIPSLWDLVLCRAKRGDFYNAAYVAVGPTQQAPSQRRSGASHGEYSNSNSGNSSSSKNKNSTGTNNSSTESGTRALHILVPGSDKEVLRIECERVGVWYGRYGRWTINQVVGESSKLGYPLSSRRLVAHWPNQTLAEHHLGIPIKEWMAYWQQIRHPVRPAALVAMQDVRARLNRLEELARSKNAAGMRKSMARVRSSASFSKSRERSNSKGKLRRSRSSSNGAQWKRKGKSTKKHLI